MAQWEFLAATFHLGRGDTNPETRGFHFTRHHDLERKLAALTDDGWELVTIDFERRWILMRRETTPSASGNLQQDASGSSLVGHGFIGPSCG